MVGTLFVSWSFRARISVASGSGFFPGFRVFRVIPTVRVRLRFRVAKTRKKPGKRLTADILTNFCPQNWLVFGLCKHFWFGDQIVRILFGGWLNIWQVSAANLLCSSFKKHCFISLMCSWLIIDICCLAIAYAMAPNTLSLRLGIASNFSLEVYRANKYAAMLAVCMQDRIGANSEKAGRWWSISFSTEKFAFTVL